MARWYLVVMPDEDEFRTVVRLPTKVAGRLDRYVAARNAAGEGARISRNSAIVVLLEKALDRAEEDLPAPPKKAAGRGR